MLLRKIILFLSIFSLVIGLIVGVTRSGTFNILQNLSLYHFLIMIGSFFGTLITLERIVTLRNELLHFLPLVNGSSIIFFLVEKPEIANLFLVLGGVILTILFLSFLFAHNDVIHWLFFISGFSYTIGMVIFLVSQNLILSVGFLELFLLITIVAERLELAKFTGISTIKKTFLLVFLIVSIVSVVYSETIFGISICLISLWLMKNDIARINVRKGEPFRFRGVALLAGYFWLLIHGLTFAIPFWYSYDMQIHSFFLGFVMNMIFAHYSIILPAVLMIKFKENYFLNYSILISFQLVLILRFVSSIFWSLGFPHSTLLNAIIVLLFFVLNMLNLIFNRYFKKV